MNRPIGEEDIKKGSHILFLLLKLLEYLLVNILGNPSSKPVLLCTFSALLQMESWGETAAINKLILQAALFCWRHK